MNLQNLNNGVEHPYAHQFYRLKKKKKPLTVCIATPWKTMLSYGVAVHTICLFSITKDGAE